MAESQQDLIDQLPPLEELTGALTWLITYWQPRNTYIEEIRKEAEGVSGIDMPKTTQYKAQPVHLHFMDSILNEKISRYLSQPEYQIVIDDPLDDDRVDFADELSKSMNVATYEMERLGDGDAWNRALVDVHLLDEGVLKMQAAPAPFWQEIVDDDVKYQERTEAGVAAYAKDLERRYPFGSEKREQYKKEQGIPIRRLYVPLENFLPQYDGPRLTYSWELEGRSLKSCRDNPLFDKDALMEHSVDISGGRNTIIPIWHYCDDQFYAYFAGASATQRTMTQSLTVQNMGGISHLTPLYIYRHGLPRSIYNCIPGRYGGWKTEHNRIESVNRGIMTLSKRIDEMGSQALTSYRASHWPTFKMMIDPEKRGYRQGQAPPEQESIPEGGMVTMYVGEDLQPIVPGVDDTRPPWIFEAAKEQLGALAGSSVVYGQRQPGVDTGYQNAQQLDQAEHLDEKIEQHIIQGAIQDGTMMLLYAKHLGEKVWCHYTEATKTKGKKSLVGEYVCIDPDGLTPIPRIAAKVRKPRPIDFVASARVARDLSDERQGKGPLLSDDTLLRDVLAVESPAEEKEKTRIEAAKNKLIASGVIDDKIAIAMNLKLAQQGQTQVTAGDVAQTPPAFQQAVQQVGATGAAIHPETLNAAAQGQNQNLNIPNGGSPAATDTQPEARIGEAVNGATGRRP